MVNLDDITVAICAFNAEKTIERAVRSALEATSGPILLVDDFSSDQTEEVAKRIAGKRLNLVRPTEKHGVGNARQTALENIDTPYGLWLDADDELLPDRATRMLSTFEESSADLIYDAAELVDGESAKTLTQLPMPRFLKGDGVWRLFERNWLPGLWGAFDTKFARTVGYDRNFYNSEDYDFILRALVKKARIQLLPDTGYRYYHYRDTVSRNLKQATGFSGQAAAKHSLAQMEKLLSATSMPKAEQVFLLCSSAQTSGQWAYVTKAASALGSQDAVIAPYQKPAASLIAFLAGGAYLKLDNPRRALVQFERCEPPDAASNNNIGACHKLLGNPGRALEFFKRALAHSPGYLDAIQNIAQIEQAQPPNITLVPLRPLAGRSSYS